MTTRSFRLRLLVGSALWTGGVLLVVAVALVVFFATHPQPHVAVFTWFISTPLVVSAVVGLMLMAVGARTIGTGLRTLDHLRAHLADVQRGTASRLTGVYPDEVQPLVDDLNALLAARDDRVARAATRAADLAHTLKTPLAVIAREAARVAPLDGALAASIEAEVTRMTRHIDHHRAQARVAAAGSTAGVAAPVAPALDGLFRALTRLHADRALRLTHDLASDVAVRCAPEDLDEMLGSLLDNACKWGRHTVQVSLQREADRVVLHVDDDGEGVDEALRAQVLQRGVRADERVPGSGLGLAIARDLAESYGGALSLARAPLGGLRASLALPDAGPRRDPSRTVPPRADAAH